MSNTPISELWPSQFRKEMAARRAKVAHSLSLLKNVGSEFWRGHEIMIGIYDAAIAAVDAASSPTEPDEHTTNG